MPLDDQTVERLLESENPSIRYFALKDLLDEPSNSTRLRAEQAKISGGLFVRSLLSGQQADGGFGVHPYAKWTGAHWRLVSLVELGIPTRHPKAVKMAGPVLEWLTGEKHRDGIKKVEGRARAHASMEGNALAACSKIGLGDDEKVRTLAQALLESQWPDGGWNCDPRPEADHSSFHESLIPLWGLTEYVKATGSRGYRKAIDRACEFFLKHKLYRSCKDGRLIKQEWLKLHYPCYWHYDLLQGLLILSRAGKLGDPRTREALDLITHKRRKDGKWQPGAYYWRRPSSTVEAKRSKDEYREPPSSDVVNWGRNGPNEMITLNASKVLKSAGRILI